MADYDLVIIGSGPAGMTAAIYAVRADLSVLMLDRLAPGGKIINTNEIQNYPGVGTVSGAELAIQMFQHTQELSVPFDYKTVKEVRVEEDGTKTVLCEEEDAEPIPGRWERPARISISETASASAPSATAQPARARTW